MTVKFYVTGIAGHKQAVTVVADDFKRAVDLRVRKFRSRETIVGNGQLCTRLYVSRRNKVTAFACHEFQVKHHFTSPGIGERVRNLDITRGLGRNVKPVDHTRLHRAAVGQKRPSHRVVVKTDKEVLIVDGNLTFRHINRCGPDALILICRFHHVGVRQTVGAYQTVVTEIIVGSVIGIVIAAVGVYHPAVFAGSSQTLINKVPDKSTLVNGIFAGNVHIFLETAAGVAHGMRVFTLYNRTVTAGICRIALDPVMRTVHRTIYIGPRIQTGTLILHRTRRILGLYPFVDFCEILAVARFISHRPHNHRRMVEIALDITHVAFHVRTPPFGTYSQSLVAIAHAMALKIGFGHHIDTHRITQVVPQIVVGIMTRADGIDIILLHDPQVLQHTLPAHHITAIRIKLMTVHTLHYDRLAIDTELPVLDLDFSETCTHRHHFLHPRSTAQSGSESIERRGLGSPFLRIINRHHRMLAP